MSLILKIALILVFAGLGYLYYVLVGCGSGVCPIRSNPLLSTGYGAVIGAFIGFVLIPSFKKKPDED